MYYKWLDNIKAKAVEGKQLITYKRWVVSVQYKNSKEVYHYGKFKTKEMAQEYACDILSHDFGATYTLKLKTFYFYK